MNHLYAHQAKYAIATALLAALASTVPASAACPTALYYADLKTGFISSSGSPVTALHALQPTTSTDPVCAGWKETVLRIPIPATCTKAIALVEFEGKTRGWLVDLGDSPSNDGFGGDAGSTPHNAELQILDGSDFPSPFPATLSVINGSGNAAAIDNPLLSQNVSLTDSAMKFVVQNQFVSWGQPYGFLQTPASKNLFDIPDPSVASADQRAVYLGLNTVVTARSDRAGCGVRSVLVKFE